VRRPHVIGIANGSRRPAVEHLTCQFAPSGETGGRGRGRLV